MSSENKSFEYGQVQISDDVLINMAGVAASSVKGVCTVRTGVTEGIANLFSKNNYSKGIKVEINDNTVVLDVNINVEYGYKINEIAREVQSAIKKEIEIMTDLIVSAVNVNVLNFIQDKEKGKAVENTDENKVIK